MRTDTGVRAARSPLPRRKHENAYYHAVPMMDDKPVSNALEAGDRSPAVLDDGVRRLVATWLTEVTPLGPF